MVLGMILLASQAFAETNCWMDEHPNEIVDGSFAFTLPADSTFQVPAKEVEEFIKFLDSELKIDTVLKSIGIVYASAFPKEDETRDEMKERVQIFLEELSSEFQGTAIGCNYINHTNPVASGHN